MFGKLLANKNGALLNLVPSIMTVRTGEQELEADRIRRKSLETELYFARVTLEKMGIKDVKPLIKVSRARRKKIK